MILEILKYVLLVLGIVAVGALVIYGLGNLMLSIIDPHGRQNKQENQTTQQQIVYEQTKLIEQAPQQENERVEQKDVQDVDLDKARQEELALKQNSNFSVLAQEEDEFIKEKQRNIEQRMAEKNVVEEPVDEINLDDIFVEDEEPQEPVAPVEEPVETDEDDDDEDIDALINRILAESEDEEVEEEQPVPVVEEVQEEQVATMDEEVEEEPVVEEVEEQNNEAEERVKALEEELARQRAEYESKLQEAQNNARNEEEENQTQARIEELENALKAKDEELKQAQDSVKDEQAETQARIEELEKALQAKDEELQTAQNKPTGAMLSLEEYEARLETLKDRLKVNDKELRAVKKEYLPLAKIKKSLEKDKIKLRRKESLVAKQKVVLYGVNNYVDIDEEKAKKLEEDLDLLDGLRLSVQHCEEVMKANEERFPILENSFNILTSTNENIKADIEECNARIAELKANQDQE